MKFLNWWLVRVALVIAFGFFPQNFWRWREPMNDGFAKNECSLSGGTLIPYLMFKKIELFSLSGIGDTLALIPMTHLVKLSLPNILFK